MKSFTTDKFRKAFDNLPENIKSLAKKTYNIWKDDPYHKILKYKQIHSSKEIYSVKIGKGWKTLGLKREEKMVWFWIGSHADYDKLIKNL